MVSVFKNCPNCGAKQLSTRKRCSVCNYDFAQLESPDNRLTLQNRWRRDEDTFAQRITANDLNRRLSKGLVIEPDTLAVIFQEGEVKAVVTSGTYSFAKAEETPESRWPWSRVRLDQQASVMLVSASVVVLNLAFDDVETYEGVPAQADLQMAVQVRDPLAVFKNLFAQHHESDETVRLEKIVELMVSRLQAHITAHAKQATIDNLLANIVLKESIDTQIAELSKKTLSTYGLDLVESRTLRLEPFGDQYEKLLEQRGQRYSQQWQIEDLEAKYDIKRRGDALRKQRDLDQLADQTEIDEAHSKAEHEQAERDAVRDHEANTNQLKRDTEIDDLQHTREDAQLDHKIETGRKLKDVKREEAVKDAQSQAQIDDVNRATEAQDFDEQTRRQREKLNLAQDARAMKNQMHDEEERQRIERDALEAKQQEEAKDNDARRQLERIRTLSEVEQGRLAADLKKTEALRDFSEDQIAALFAKDSPEVAQALAEKYRAQAATKESSEQKELYERLLAVSHENQQENQRLMAAMLETMARLGGAQAESQKQHTEDIKDVSQNAMDRVADVAGKSAASPQPKGPGRPTNLATAKGNCPRCGAIRSGAALCENCGFRFEDVVKK